jgi:isopenicillin N synthase-like dioxygenase
MDSVMEQSRLLFDLPESAKLKLDKRQSDCNRGYETLGGQTLQPGALPDRKEGFYIGEEVSEGDPRFGQFNQGANQWPIDMPAFQPTMMAYYGALCVVSANLMRGMALSLNLEEHAFEAFTRRPLTALRLLHYPPSRPEVPDEMGAGAHTDFGGLTFLMQDDVGGLQVNSQCGWIEAPMIPGAYIVNLGDMIARWTNNRYVSSLHRVINRSGRERYSVPFFYTGNPHYEVRCLETCLNSGEQPAYPPIKVEEHLKAMYARTYSN